LTVEEEEQKEVIYSKNLNWDRLLNYCKQGTLNDRVIDNYENFNIFTRRNNGTERRIHNYALR
jgi:hypothetical protein